MIAPAISTLLFSLSTIIFNVNPGWLDIRIFAEKDLIQSGEYERLLTLQPECTTHQIRILVQSSEKSVS